MNLGEYLKEKVWVLLINMLIFVFVSILFFLYNLNRWLILLIFIIWLLPIVTLLTFDYFKKAHYYSAFLSQFNSIDKKHLISEVMDKPSFVEGKILYDILKETGRFTNEFLNIYKTQQNEYREYIETWVHEIKTPIASGKLVIENNKNDVTLSILEELIKTEELVEQVLYYSKSNSTEEDYIIKEFSLEYAVNQVIKKNYKSFIQKGIKLRTQNLSCTVFSDTKWVIFIINQIVTNSIKYLTHNNPVIKIYAKTGSNNITLIIEDNGIGIESQDISQVFNKGFTGTNGRRYKASTGMGLYLCKKLATRLGLKIDITSEPGIGTKLSIIFPKSKMTLLN